MDWIGLDWRRFDLSNQPRHPPPYHRVSQGRGHFGTTALGEGKAPRGTTRPDECTLRALEPGCLRGQRAGRRAAARESAALKLYHVPYTQLNSRTPSGVQNEFQLHRNETSRPSKGREIANAQWRTARIQFAPR